MKDELKPCPFCGAEAKPVFKGRLNYVVCSNERECWCGMTASVSTPEEAVAIWNSRIEEEEDTQERIDEDARKPFSEYWGCRWIECTECPATIGGETPMKRYHTPRCEIAQTLDLLRRQRELDGKGAE